MSMEWRWSPRGGGRNSRPEVGPRSRARLVVLAGEVGGRWSAETMSFLGLLAKARARSETSLLRRRVEQAWRIRWGSMLACAAARAFAASLLDQWGLVATRLRATKWSLITGTPGSGSASFSRV